jgi:hypothetical protein
LGLFKVEVIATIDIDMPIAGGPDPGEVTVLNRIALTFELINHCGYIDRIPEDDGIGDEIEVTGLMDEFLPSFAAELAFVGEHEIGAQIMESLSLIELAQHPAAIVRVGVPLQDMERSDQSPIFLKHQG